MPTQILANTNLQKQARSMGPVSGLDTRECYRLFPFALDYETRPIKRRLPSFVMFHGKFRMSQRIGRRKSVFHHSFIKILHEFSSCLVIDLPQTGDDAL